MLKMELSTNQKALWFIQAFNGAAKSVYNEPLVYTLKGFISINALKKALDSLIQKHSVLRTSFEKDEEGNLFQVVHEAGSLDFSTVENLQPEIIQEYICQKISQPFDLSKSPLMRVCLIKLSDDEYLLVIVMHHIITDGSSFGIFINDLNDFYNQIMRGQTITSTADGASYLNHVESEKNKFSSPLYQSNIDEMVNSLQNYSGLNFLTTLTGSEKIDIYTGDRVYFNLDSDVCAKLYAFSQQHRTTLFHFLFAAYCLFLNHYTRSADIVIGVPFANRENHNEHPVMGYFVNTLPVRVTLNEQSNFLELISHIKLIVFSYLCKQDLAFEHIAQKLNLERKNSGQHPLIQTLFVLGSTDKLQLRFEGVEATLEQAYFSKTAKFDLSLFMLEENKKTVTAYFEYRDTLFDKSIIKSLTNNFIILIKNILENPKRLLSSISLLDEAEKCRMKEKFFIAKLDRLVNYSLSDLFSQTVASHKQQTALIFGDKRYTYEELNARSNSWANYIRAKFKQLYDNEMPSDTLVALCVDRNEDMIFGMLGILKAGGAYVPIDTNYPHERINYIINHSKASMLLTHKVHEKLNLDFPASHIIFMDDETIQQSPNFVNQKLTCTINAKDIAYVLYTSGSTGKPKGVAVSHENVICLFESLKKQFQISEQDIWSLFHTFCFDISVWEIWGAFLFGGSLLIIPYETTRDPKQFYQLIKDEKVSVLTQTASAFQMFINEDSHTENKLTHLRYVAFVGESLKVSILRTWVEKYGTQQPRLANMYGITETTVYTNYKFVEQIDINRGRDNIGWPLEEFSMCVMDENMQWCPVGIVGEICIGGRGLSRGYLYRDDLTKEKFIPDPYAEFLGLEKNTRLYRTGDLGRWMEDGSIEYLGRKDFQIKLRGFRIELGEIESALGSYESISHTAVLLKGEGDSAYLAAYYTVKPGSQVDVGKLMSHLKSFLPEYMVPKTFTELSSFPMTVNGKIDRRELHTYQDKINQSSEHNSLASPLEHEIAMIWASILKIDVKQIGSSSNFFELGGNSLLVVKMLTLVSNKMAKDLSLSQFISVPTIASLSAQASNLQSSANSLREQLRKDIILEENIQPLKEINSCINDPKTILLTGATGFLGVHMLHELLEKTSANIYCLTRAASIDEARNRLMEKLQKYKLYSANNLSRIIPILGDLSQSKLGLSEHDYDKLVKDVDAIFHVGALVHHVLDYQTLYKINVQPVREMLNMAVCMKNKAIHFVSTLATLLISPLDQITSEQKHSLKSQLNFNGYLTTKWVAEQLLEQAWARGIVAHVYRPGNIIAGLQGVYDAEMNHTLLRLKGMLQLEQGFVDSKETLEMMPVDLLSRAIIDISRNPKRFSYNMNNHQSISWYDYLKFANDLGYRFKFLQNEKDWNAIINNLTENNALYKLAHLYKARPVDDQEFAENNSIQPDYIIPTPSYKEMIEKQFLSLIACGFIDSPQGIENPC